MSSRTGPEVARLARIGCGVAVWGLSFVAICARQAAAIDVEAAPNAGPQWPQEPGLSATTFDDRFRQLDRAVGDLRDQLHLLAGDVQENADHPSAPMRRREEGFRGIYMMDRDGTHARYLIAAPGMITNAD